jgi:hypothetical protein
MLLLLEGVPQQHIHHVDGKIAREVRFNYDELQRVLRSSIETALDLPAIVIGVQAISPPFQIRLWICLCAAKIKRFGIKRWITLWRWRGMQDYGVLRAPNPDFMR